MGFINKETSLGAPECLYKMFNMLPREHGTNQSPTRPRPTRVVVMPETVPGLVPMIPGSTSPGNLTLPMGYTMIYPKWQWGTNDSHWILGDTVSDKPWNSLEF